LQMGSASRAARQPQPRSHTHCLHLPPPPHPSPDCTMACYLPMGEEIGHAHTSQMGRYYCFCVCTIIKSSLSLRATNNGNFLQSSGAAQAPVAGRMRATVCAPLLYSIRLVCHHLTQLLYKITNNSSFKLLDT